MWSLWVHDALAALLCQAHGEEARGQGVRGSPAQWKVQKVQVWGVWFLHALYSLPQQAQGRQICSVMSFIVIDSKINPAFYSIFSLCGCALDLLCFKLLLIECIFNFVKKFMVVFPVVSIIKSTLDFLFNYFENNCLYWIGGWLGELTRKYIWKWKRKEGEKQEEREKSEIEIEQERQKKGEIKKKLYERER